MVQIHFPLFPVTPTPSRASSVEGWIATGPNRMTDSAFGTFNAEVATNEIRRDTLDGRPHIVAPVVAVRSMVLKGEYLPAEEIQASAPAWNGRPLPVNHPTDSEGNFTTANAPSTLSAQNVGRFFGADATEADDGQTSLVGEIWVDVEKSTNLASNGDEEYAQPLAILASHADADLEVEVEANADGGVLEVSTAYFYEPEDATGVNNGEDYERVQRNLRPDHLALLPNEKGECSAEDGCGAPRVHVHAAEANSPDATFGDLADGQTAANDSTSTMSHDIETLAELTAFSQERLEDMSDEDLSALAESVETASHDDCGCDGAQSNDDGSDGDGDDDSTVNADDAAVPAELTETITALESKVDNLESDLAAQEQDERESYVETVTANSEKFDAEDLSDVPTDTLATMADEFESRAGTADMSARIGASNHSGGDDAAEEFTGLVSALNGSDEGGD